MNPVPPLNPQRLYDERNNFFTGKYMTARDFREEQWYFLSHQRWHQWNLHGWGIVWGLQVKLDRECVTISPGVALDCYGRELVLPYKVHFAVADLAGSPSSGNDQQQRPDTFLLGLQFEVVGRELVPLLVAEPCQPHEANHPHEQKHNRVRERAKICYRDYCDKCWSFPSLSHAVALPQPIPARQQHGEQQAPCECCVSLTEHHASDECACPLPPVAFQPECDCQNCGFVPLAKVWKCGDEYHANDYGCRYVQSPFYGEALTHIVGINWNHAEHTKFKDLKEAYRQPVTGASRPATRLHEQCGGNGGRIVVTFDRELAVPKSSGNSQHQQAAPDLVEEANYLSAYFAQLIKLDYTAYGEFDLDGDDPPQTLALKSVSLSPCRKQLYCDFAAHKVKHHLPVRMRFSLNCDMILDVRGRAVDGNHLHGSVPYVGNEHCPPAPGARSGDGTEGGTFYSWTLLQRSGHSAPTQGNRVEQDEELD